MDARAAMCWGVGRDEMVCTGLRTFTMCRIGFPRGACGETPPGDLGAGAQCSSHLGRPSAQDLRLVCPMQLGRTGLHTAEKRGKHPFQGPHSMWAFYSGPIESLTAGPVGFPISQGVRQTPARGYLEMFPTDFHPRKLLGGEEPPAKRILYARSDRLTS